MQLFRCKMKLWFMSNLLPLFSLQSCSTKGVCRMSSATVTHQMLTHYLSTVAACFQFSGQYCPLFWVNITCLKIQYANHKHSCALTSPWCRPLTFQPTGLKISIISMLAGTSAESLAKEDMNVLWVFLAQASRTLVPQSSFVQAFGKLAIRDGIFWGLVTIYSTRATAGADSGQVGFLQLQPPKYHRDSVQNYRKSSYFLTLNIEFP